MRVSCEYCCPNSVTSYYWTYQELANHWGQHEAGVLVCNRGGCEARWAFDSPIDELKHHFSACRSHQTSGVWLLSPEKALTKTGVSSIPKKGGLKQKKVRGRSSVRPLPPTKREDWVEL